jgi:hypothetical protein
MKIKELKVGDRILVPIDNRGEMTSDPVQKVGTIAATVVRAASPPIVGWKENETRVPTVFGCFGAYDQERDAYKGLAYAAYISEDMEVELEVKKPLFVRCIKNDGIAEGHLVIGKTYEVESKYGTDGYVLKDALHPFDYWAMDRFEIVSEEPKAKENPKLVRCIDNRNCAKEYLIQGQIYEITDESSIGYSLKGVEHPFGKWNKDRFKVIDAAEEKPMEETKQLPKKVKCISNSGVSPWITIGQVYEIEGEEFGDYLLKGVSGVGGFQKSRFVPVEEEIKKPMMVKCVDPGISPLLKIDGLYEVEKEEAERYWLKGVDAADGYFKFRFLPVKEEPIKEEKKTEEKKTEEKAPLMVRCINRGANAALKVGDLYEVESETKDRYIIKGMSNDWGGWYKWRFEIVEAKKEPIAEEAPKVEVSFVPFKVQCINNGGPSALTLGNVYEVISEEPEHYLLKDTPSRWYKHRFILHQEEDKAKASETIYVKCIDNDGVAAKEKLTIGSVYEVITKDYNKDTEYVLKNNAQHGWRKNRFEVVAKPEIKAAEEVAEGKEVEVSSLTFPIKAKCIDNTGFNMSLKIGNTYEFSSEEEDKFILKSNGVKWRKFRFEVLPKETEASKEEVKSMFPFKVKCVDSYYSSSRLTQGEIYEVVGESSDGSKYLIGADKLSWRKTRFEKVEAPKIEEPKKDPKAEEAETETIRVRCIDNSGAYPGVVLQKGKIYELSEGIDKDELNYHLKWVSPTLWGKHRFEIVAKDAVDQTIAELKTIGRKVQCIDNSGSIAPEALVIGKVYEVIDENTTNLYLKDVSPNGWKKSRFQDVETKQNLILVKCIDETEKGKGKTLLKDFSYEATEISDACYDIAGQAHKKNIFKVFPKAAVNLTVDPEPEATLPLKVRCIDALGANDTLTKGAIYTVKEDLDTDYILQGITTSWLKSRFEIVKEEVEAQKTIKRVRCIDALSEKELIIDAIYEVESENNTYYSLKGLTHPITKMAFQVLPEKPVEQITIVCIDNSAIEQELDKGHTYYAIECPTYPETNYLIIQERFGKKFSKSATYRKDRFKLESDKEELSKMEPIKEEVNPPKEYRVKCINTVETIPLLTQDRIYIAIDDITISNRYHLLREEESGKPCPLGFHSVYRKDRFEVLAAKEEIASTPVSEESIEEKKEEIETVEEPKTVIPKDTDLKVRCLIDGHSGLTKKGEIYLAKFDGASYFDIRKENGKSINNTGFYSTDRFEVIEETKEVKKAEIPRDIDLNVRCLIDGNRLLTLKGEIYIAKFDGSSYYDVRKQNGDLVSSEYYSENRFEVIEEVKMPKTEKEEPKPEEKVKTKVKCIDNEPHSSFNIRLELDCIYELEDESSYSYFINGMEWRKSRFTVMPNETEVGPLKKVEAIKPRTFKVKCIANHSHSEDTTATLILNNVYSAEKNDFGQFFIDGKQWGPGRFEVMPEETPLGLIEVKKFKIKCIDNSSGDLGAARLQMDYVYEAEKKSEVYLIDGIPWNEERFEVMPDETPVGLPPKKFKLRCIIPYSDTTRNLKVEVGQIYEAPFHSNGRSYFLQGVEWSPSWFEVVPDEPVAEPSLEVKQLKVRALHNFTHPIFSLKEDFVYEATFLGSNFKVHGAEYSTDWVKEVSEETPLGSPIRKVRALRSIGNEHVAPIVKGSIYQATAKDDAFYLNGKKYPSTDFEIVSDETPLGHPGKVIRVRATGNYEYHTGNVVKDTVYEVIDNGGNFILNDTEWYRGVFTIVPNETPLGLPALKVEPKIKVRARSSYSLGNDPVVEGEIYEVIRKDDLFYLNDTGYSNTWLEEIKEEQVSPPEEVQKEPIAEAAEAAEVIEPTEAEEEKEKPKKEANPFGMLLACIGAGASLSHYANPTASNTKMGTKKKRGKKSSSEMKTRNQNT